MWKLCKLADIDLSAYQKFLRGETAMLRRSTLDRIDAVLEALPGREEKLTPAIVAALHRTVMASLAKEMRAGVDRVLAADFSRQRPKDRDWLRAARIRRLAMYIVVTELDIGLAQLARAIGVSKQNVGQALSQVEDRRDEPKIARLIDSVASRFTGKS